MSTSKSVIFPYLYLVTCDQNTDHAHQLVLPGFRNKFRPKICLQPLAKQ